MAASVSATQVGSYFVQQYYQILQQQPDYTHQFYNDSSTVVRVDGETTESASALLQIHALITSLNFTAIEIKTINSLESWSGGVVVVVSGSVKSKDFSGWRKFLQTFFLAPQEKGYFVLNDIFHFVNEEVINQAPALGVSEVIHQTPAPVAVENKSDSQPASSVPLQEPPVSDYTLDAEAGEYGNSVHIEGDDAVEDYSYREQEQEQEQEQNAGAETVDEGTSLEESSGFMQNEEDTAQEPLPAVEEPVGELPKVSYASILRAPKGNPTSTVTVQPSFNKKASQPPLLQSNAALSVAPDISEDVAEETFSHKEGESKSIYVRNLPSGVSSLEVMEEFKNFGRIKQDGVFVNNRKEIGVCYAFVEFEDVQSAQNAVKASPIKLAGRQVYVELRKPSIGSTTRGGRRGRGRGGRLGGRFGRGSNLDSNDSNKGRSNGFRSS
ncbi:unnamed protein product [Coffea canephora]|uniref:G3BP-like protein n=1 Tax=Coffea canephora TaxID=49390 RepID=A0A068U6J2_COFCA|nr:unnamed protein product [Coffea canephora]